MAVYNYAEQFERQLQQKYARELTCNSLMLANPQIKFINAQTIKLPKITVSGYKDHNRNILGFNSGKMTNEWEPKKLEHDRDIELFIDPMDIDETNLTLEMANLTNTFEEEQVIPEVDSYVYSKLYTEAEKYKSNGAVINTDTIDETNILDWFDEEMARMDDLGVPTTGRELRLTSKMQKYLKNAKQVVRTISGSTAGKIDRRVHDIEDVKIIPVPSGRFMTLYDFTDGCVADSTAKQINMMLTHPSCQVTKQKYSYIKTFTPGSDSRTADKYLYQNRKFWDSFIIQNKACAMAFNVAPEQAPAG